MKVAEIVVTDYADIFIALCAQNLNGKRIRKTFLRSYILAMLLAMT